MRTVYDGVSTRPFCGLISSPFSSRSFRGGGVKVMDLDQARSQEEEREASNLDQLKCSNSLSKYQLVF